MRGKCERKKMRHEKGNIKQTRKNNTIKYKINQKVNNKMKYMSNQKVKNIMNFKKTQKVKHKMKY